MLNWMSPSSEWTSYYSTCANGGPLPVCAHSMGPPPQPPRHEQNLLGAHDCIVTFKHHLQPIRSHIESFGGKKLFRGEGRDLEYCFEWSNRHTDTLTSLLAWLMNRHDKVNGHTVWAARMVQNNVSIIHHRKISNRYSLTGPPLTRVSLLSLNLILQPPPHPECPVSVLAHLCVEPGVCSTPEHKEELNTR